jgi:hypothetical protein
MLVFNIEPTNATVVSKRRISCTIVRWRARAGFTDRAEAVRRGYLGSRLLLGPTWNDGENLMAHPMTPRCSIAGPH